MTDKRIQQFLEFTEQNLTGSPERAGGYSFRFPNARILKRLAVTLLPIVCIMLVKTFPLGTMSPFKGYSDASREVSRSHSTLKIANHGLSEGVPFERALKSQIPALHLAAVQQRLYPTPLRKAEQVVFHHEGDDFNESWVVLDSVVFIPKITG